MQVSAFALNQAGFIAFQKYVHDLFEPYGPSDFHKLIPSFRWRVLATTNYDLIIERAYEVASDETQNLVVSFKDGDGFDARMRGTLDPVGYYKLHGTIAHYTDETIPLILDNEQYVKYEENRGRFYNRFRDLGAEYSVIFAGYSVNDPHIQKVLFDLTDAKRNRPMYYYVSPNIDPLEESYWASNRVTCISSTFDDFLLSLDQAIPATARSLPASLGGGELSIRTHYRVANASESLLLRTYLATDVSHIRGGMTAAQQDAKAFYKGQDIGWGCILQNLDVRRRLVDSILVEAVLVDDDLHTSTELYVLKGPAGNGKTVALKRLAWEAAVEYGQLCLYCNSSAALNLEALEEVHRLTGRRIFLFIDHVALVRFELLELLKSAKLKSLPLTVLATERDNEWNIYCERLEPFLSQSFAVRYLREEEITGLLELLDRHNALGELKSKAPAARLAAFKETAGRQLLVALHEATLGVAFEDIIADEYSRIEPPVARQLYLEICALHQFGAPVRAGLISRVSGITFDRFKAEFLAPLENVVHAIQDNHVKDIYYKARHQHVAEIVFNRVLPTPESKFDLLSRLVSGINSDYSSDRETFQRLIKGRGITELFHTVDLGRLFYDQIESTIPDDGFVLQQRAIFEYTHQHGSLTRAEEAIKLASTLEPKSQSIRHTYAEITRRLANSVSDPVKKESYRKISREKLGNILSRMSEYELYTRAKIYIDELREFSEQGEGQSETPPQSLLVDLVKNAEEAIQLAISLHPDSAELHAADAEFLDLLDKAKPAQVALERAFNSNPRQDWLAIRLAKKYRQASDWPRYYSTLDKCLQVNPGSKNVHFEYALD